MKIIRCFLLLLFSCITIDMLPQKYITVTSNVDVNMVSFKNKDVEQELITSIFDNAPDDFIKELKNYKYISLSPSLNNNNEWICRLTNRIDIRRRPPVGYVLINKRYLFVYEKLPSFMSYLENKQNFVESDIIQSSGWWSVTDEDDTPGIKFKIINNLITDIEYFF